LSSAFDGWTGYFKGMISSFARMAPLTFFMQKLTITVAELLATATTIRTAFIAGDLFTTENVLTQDITADAKNFASYANRSFIMARKFDWNNALQDATKVIPIHHTLTRTPLT
jgi:hypothetical protein